MNLLAAECLIKLVYIRSNRAVHFLFVALFDIRSAAETDVELRRLFSTQPLTPHPFPTQNTNNSLFVLPHLNEAPTLQLSTHLFNMHSALGTKVSLRQPVQHSRCCLH